MSRARALAKDAAAKALAFLGAHPRVSAAGLLAAAALLPALVFALKGNGGDALSAVVRRGTLVGRLTVSGVLRPARSITYRSPLGGREAEIVFLAPEGTVVGEGDLVARLDTTELRRELERAVQELRQAELEVKVAEAERAEGRAAIESLTEGEGALSVEEARASLALAERKVQRLREAYEANRPLMEKGFLTRDELDKSAFELEQAEAELALARKKAQVFIERTHPRDRQRAQVTLSQKEAQLQNAKARLAESTARAIELRDQIEGCSLYARAPGLVVYEEHLGASPRRKIRTGDRVTGSQGLVTIPEVTRMLVEASAPETEIHRVQPGQAAAIRLDAYPALRLTGKVTRVGTLARASAERPFEEKRFDVIIEVDGAPSDLRPEMTARADIVVSERKDALLVPVNAVFDRDGTPVVHVLRAFSTDTRIVELGETDDLVVEVRRGVTEGERVSLQDHAGTAAQPGPAPAPAAGGMRGRMKPGGGEPAGVPLAPR